MELRDALAQISDIRDQMARGQIFRGYRSATSAATGVIAVVAGLLQPVITPAPAHAVSAYIALWFCAALVSIVVVGAEMILRTRRSGSQIQSQLTLLAVEQFVPSIVAGGLLTAVIALAAPDAAWMLSGLWTVLFALGVFASCRVLPRSTFWIGAYYLLAGITVLLLSKRGLAFNPWLMGVTFGVGQLATSVLLLFTLERTPASNL